MGDYSRVQVVEKVRAGEPLERADLRHAKLGQAELKNARMRRADLEGANLEAAMMQKANLASACLRDAYMVGANLEGASLKKADLEGANLKNANLQKADLSRANLEGANLEGAKINGARLTSAQLEQANMGGAEMVGVELTNADLHDAYLGGAKLAKADLRFAKMDGANLEEADLSHANLTESNLRKAYCDGANFTSALLERALLDKSALNKANFQNADLRGSSLREAKVTGAKMTGAKLAGCDATPEQLAEVNAEWVDFSTKTNKVKIKGPELVDYFTKLKGGAPVLPPEMLETFVNTGAPTDTGNRYFGEGDVLRNAALEFGEKAQVLIQSRFENCTIVLVEGAKLTVGQQGTLNGCSIEGAGDVVIQGSFCKDGEGPSIMGAKRLVVGNSGSIIGTVEQHEELTLFGFERGCKMDLKIVRA